MEQAVESQTQETNKELPVVNELSKQQILVRYLQVFDRLLPFLYKVKQMWWVSRIGIKVIFLFQTGLCRLCHPDTVRYSTSMSTSGVKKFNWCAWSNWILCHSIWIWCEQFYTWSQEHACACLVEGPSNQRCTFVGLQAPVLDTQWGKSTVLSESNHVI